MQKPNKKSLWIFLNILFLSLFTQIISIEAHESKDKDIFPLKKGNYWIYQGVVIDLFFTNVKSPAATSNDIWRFNILFSREKVNKSVLLEKTLTWKMEVVDVIVRDQMKVALIKGHPQDLTWYEKGQTRDESLIVSINDAKFYLIYGSKRRKEFLEKLNRNPQEAILLLDDQWDMFAAFPLNPGQFCDGREHTSLLDWFGRCYVEDEEKMDLSDVKGLRHQKFSGYHLAQRDNTGHTFINFVPGVGITHYIYSHHGTVSEVDMKLIKFYQAN